MKILVVCGGDSSEKEVSLKTGEAISNTLRANFDSVECFVCNDKRHCVRSIIEEKPDKVFIALHGSWGENGELQAALDMLGIPYTGSNFEASALAMNKFATKSIIKNLGIPSAKGVLIKNIEDVEKLNCYPICLKPNKEGSSVGVEFADNKKQAKEKAKYLLERFSELIAEEKLVGKEMTATVMGNEVFPIIEIRPKKGFYDYKNKYTKGSTEYIVPAPLDERVEDLCRAVVKKTYDAIGCSGCARVDFILKNNVPYVLEVNTMPGMTQTSLVPKSAKAAGISFEELVKRMVEFDDRL